ncbi:hypothetical protein BH20PSE1_BH20PSE1_01240 [soil metagenome]
MTVEDEKNELLSYATMKLGNLDSLFCERVKREQEALVAVGRASARGIICGDDEPPG